MTSKYFYGCIACIFGIVMFSSCLGDSTTTPIDASSDAQIYGLSAKAAYDKEGILKNTKFSIDQINNKIFNAEPLKFGFEPKNVALTVTSSSSSPITVEIYLSNPDTNYVWNRTDSVNIKRLTKLVTKAQDNTTTKTYQFTLNRYSEDPNVLSWNNVSSDYLPKAAEASVTVSFQDKYYTYYRLSGAMYAKVSSDGKTGTVANATGLDASVDLRSVKSTQNALYAISGSGIVYKSTDGTTWQKLTTEYPVKSIYGVLPTSASDSILTVVTHNSALHFAKTKDFSTFHVMNIIPSELPVQSFSSVSVSNKSVYSSKFIIISGGKTNSGTAVENGWILQESNGAITHITTLSPITDANGTLQGSTLFLYDNKLYILCTAATGKNALYSSINYGVDWVKNDTHQLLPTDLSYRQYASIWVDAKHYIRIFSGISGSSILTDTWEGILNKYK